MAAFAAASKSQTERADDRSGAAQAEARPLGRARSHETNACGYTALANARASVWSASLQPLSLEHGKPGVLPVGFRSQQGRYNGPFVCSSHWILCGVAFADGSRDDCVGRVLWLAQSR